MFTDKLELCIFIHTKDSREFFDFYQMFHAKGEVYMSIQNDSPSMISGAVLVHPDDALSQDAADTTLFEKVDNVEIINKEYKGVVFLFTTPKPEEVSYVVRNVNGVSYDIDTGQVSYKGKVVGNRVDLLADNFRIVLNDIATDQIAESVVRAVGVDFAEEAQDVTLCVIDGAGQKSEKLIIKASVAPVDQNPIHFIHHPDLINIALRCKSFDPKAGVFIPTFGENIGCKITNKDTITNNATADGWDKSIVFSSDVIKNGRISLTVGQTNAEVILGFSASFRSHHYDIIEYGIFADKGETYIIENGVTHKPSFGSHTTNDVFAVERTGYTVTYLKNEFVFYTSTMHTVQPMYLCITFAKIGALVTNVRQHNFYIPVVYFTPKFDQGTGYKVTNTNTITFVSPTPAWSGNIVFSSDVIGEGSVSLRVGQVSAGKEVMLGFAQKYSQKNYQDIDYALYVHEDTLRIAESGRIYETVLGKCTTSDVLAVERHGSVVTYLKNGVVLHTSAKKSTKAMHLCITALNNNTKVVDVQQRNFDSRGGFFDVKTIGDINVNQKTREVSYKNTVVAIINQNTIPRFNQGIKFTITNMNTVTFMGGAGSWYNRIVFSSDVIKNGCISFKMGQTNRPVVLGFAQNYINQNYYDITYGIYTSNNSLNIMESGEESASALGQYTVDDILSVERHDDIVTYLKNGVVFYTSVHKTIADMHLCITAYDKDSKVVDVQQRNFDSKYDTDGFYIGFNDKASQEAIDSIAEAVSCQSVALDTTVEILYSVKAISALKK